jgi:biofilm protein TabA
MALFGSLSTVRGQAAAAAQFAAAFAHLEECFRAGSDANRRLTALAAGESDRIDLAGGAFSLLQAYQTKPRAEGKWETHRAYIDVQAVLSGEELMEVTDRGRLTVSEDLTPAKDVIFYKPFDRGNVLRFGPGDVAIYFPVDAHMGNLAAAGPSLVRKIVVKVPVQA